MGHITPQECQDNKGSFAAHCFADYLCFMASSRGLMKLALQRYKNDLMETTKSD
jgi:hypothetical protein